MYWCQRFRNSFIPQCNKNFLMKIKITWYVRPLIHQFFTSVLIFPINVNGSLLGMSYIYTHSASCSISLLFFGIFIMVYGRKNSRFKYILKDKKSCLILNVSWCCQLISSIFMYFGFELPVLKHCMINCGHHINNKGQVSSIA